MNVFEFLNQHSDKILRLLFLLLISYFLNYDYKNRKAFGFSYWMSVLETIFLTVSGLTMTVLFALGTWNAWFGNRSLWLLSLSFCYCFL